ncbi:MAG TPA: outer membrane beta-barrel protein, partial [Nitrospiria bacterium]|nr:outer membrane beta-barrel protein [Nitrospiria bacterium]
GSQSAPFGAGTGTALWQGYAIYANMALGDKHSVTVRGEVFDDQEGFKSGATFQPEGVTGRELTITFSCKMKENLEWRAEVRHDEANRDVFAGSDAAATNPDKDSQNTVAVAAYYSF